MSAKAQIEAIQARNKALARENAGLRTTRRTLEQELHEARNVQMFRLQEMRSVWLGSMTEIQGHVSRISNEVSLLAEHLSQLQTNIHKGLDQRSRASSASTAVPLDSRPAKGEPALSPVNETQHGSPVSSDSPGTHNSPATQSSPVNQSSPDSSDPWSDSALPHSPSPGLLIPAPSNEDLSKVPWNQLVLLEKTPEISPKRESGTGLKKNRDTGRSSGRLHADPPDAPSTPDSSSSDSSTQGSTGGTRSSTRAAGKKIVDYTVSLKSKMRKGHRHSFGI